MQKLLTHNIIQYGRSGLVVIVKALFTVLSPAYMYIDYERSSTVYR